eukprot:m.172141 g.172141  ORF g.172141 m.172141 type:complete len:873 (-) comp13479_c0_seq1:84-2702(-)
MPGGMRKARNYDIAETNICGLGTPLEKAIREASAGHEDAWKKIEPQKCGIFIWRIEKFLVVPWPKNKYGKFFNGDSYIVLHTYKSKGGRGAVAWDVHFWIGSESTQDEYGTAAYKTVELDDYLGGAATQYRETEQQMSRKFRALFSNRITILEGGIESGFNRIEDDAYPKRLLHVKGGMNTVVKSVPISWESLNSGDSFILDTGSPVKDADGKVKEGMTDGNLLLVFHGSSASPMEKVKASGLAQAIDDERGGKPERETYHDGQSYAELEPFWKALGGGPPRGQSIKTAEEGGSDDSVKKGEKRLLQVSDASGKISMKLIASGDSLNRNAVHSDDVFILDDGYEVMVWVGKGASSKERKEALNFAQQYLNDYGEPSDKVISRMLEGGDNEQFEAAFEVGVMSEARPGDGVKFSGDIDKIRGLQKTKAASATVSATYKGSGGPGVAIDFDALYRQPCADPAEWRGRSKPESSYSKEMQEKSLGAYNAESGWVASLSEEQRKARQRRIQSLEQKYIEEGKDAGATHFGGTDILVSAGTEGSLQPAHGFDPVKDAEGLRAAMKGLGTRKNPMVEILTGKTLGQRIEIRKAYEEHIGRDLFRDIESEWQLGGNFERILKVLIRDPYERDANFLYKALRALRPDTGLVLEILCTQESSEIDRIAKAYSIQFQRNLVEDLEREYTSALTGLGDTGKLLIALASGKRPPNGPVDAARAKADAEALYVAGEKKMLGCDEDKFIEILSERSYNHIVAVADAYPQFPKRKTPLIKSIRKKTGGSLRVALKTILAVSSDPTAYYAERLKKALDGQLVGTHDTSLIRIIVSRAEIDLSTIEAIFASTYGEALQDKLAADTSKHYMRTLLAIVNGNKDDLNSSTA